MAKYIKIDPFGDICIAEDTGKTMTLEINGVTTMNGNLHILSDDAGDKGDLFVHGDLTVYGTNGNISAQTLTVSDTISTNALFVDSTLTLNGTNANIQFPNASNSRILWHSSEDPNRTDYGYILYLGDSHFLRDDGTQCSRLSFGVLDNHQMDSNADMLDIQGAAKLVLNAGVYDDEIFEQFPDTHNYGPGPCDIEFRINNTPIGGVDENGMHATAFTETSDASLKTDIHPLDDPLGKLLCLQGISFKWKNRSPSSPAQIGFIAQEVEPYFPEIVVTDINGLKSVRYSRLVAPMVEAIKELCLEIERLKQEIAAQKETVVS